MQKLLVILGPTSTGKTDLALKLARKFNGELVSCDSRQVYKGLDIGTGKMPSKKLGVRGWELGVRKRQNFWEIGGIKIRMYDVANPKNQYTVSDYVKDANNVLSQVLKTEKLPIVVGGTGLYLKALLEGIGNLIFPIDGQLREDLSQFSLQQLQDKLKKLSPSKFISLNQADRKNPRRLLRSIELLSMYPYREKIKLPLGVPKSKVKSWDVLKIGLTAPRECLREKIYQRILARLDQGMIEEARKLHERGLTYKRMEELGLEYGLIAQFLQKKISKEELIESLKIKIGQYSKRQMTWFKKEKDVNWIDIKDPQAIKKVERLIKVWYDQPWNEQKS